MRPPYLHPQQPSLHFVGTRHLSTSSPWSPTLYSRTRQMKILSPRISNPKLRPPPAMSKAVGRVYTTMFHSLDISVQHGVKTSWLQTIYKICKWGENGQKWKKIFGKKFSHRFFIQIDHRNLPWKWERSKKSALGSCQRHKKKQDGVNPSIVCVFWQVTGNRKQTGNGCNRNHSCD